MKLCTLYLLASLFPLAGSVDVPDKKPQSRNFEFTYQVRISQVPASTQQLDLWLPYPKTDHNQEILDLQVTAPEGWAVYREPEHGNLVLYTPLRDPFPLPVEVELRFTVTRREYIRKEFHRAQGGDPRFLPEEVARYLQPSTRVPLNEQIRQWALEVTRDHKTDLEKARAIYDYAIANLQYDKSGEGWGEGDLLYVCDEKRGNCTDFHSLFVGFARAVGIPARFSIGFPLPEERGEGVVAGYHCWAEFYLAGYGWVPLDASEAWKNPKKLDYFFGAHDENRVEFTTGRDLVLRPRQQGPPLNYFIYPYAEADGQPFRDLEWGFSFRDLSPASEAKPASP